MSKETQNPKTQTCPYLGLHDDSTSHMAFTSPLNCCHGSKSSPTPVKMEHQNAHCLTSEFADCPVFLAGSKKSFPRNLRARTKSAPRGRRRSWLPAYLMIALIVFGAVFWVFTGGELPFLTATPLPTLTLSVTATETATPILNTPSPVGTETPTLDPNITPSVTPFPTLTYTPTPSATITKTPTQTRTPTITPTPSDTPTPTTAPRTQRALDMPLGTVQKFIIHKLTGGENLTYLATQHNTSIEAILAVNYNLDIPVRKDSLIVIPLDVENPSTLPVLEIYQVPVENITVENLAVVLETDANLLKYYNYCQDNEYLYKGDWVLVPRGDKEE